MVRTTELSIRNLFVTCRAPAQSVENAGRVFISAFWYPKKAAPTYRNTGAQKRTMGTSVPK
ncbi:hypothetical protein A8E82_24155 [Burkholderia cenocepacia]|nr:hypothetical protein A8E82_24155 [Burkholderia cenocepacia]